MEAKGLNSARAIPGKTAMALIQASARVGTGNNSRNFESLGAEEVCRIHDLHTEIGDLPSVGILDSGDC